MAQPEYNKVVVPVLAYLNSLAECKAINIHGGVYTEKGTPDIIGCYRGRMFAFEAKAKNGRLARIQAVRLEQWALTGAIVGVIYSLDDVKQLLREPEVT